MDVSFSLCLVGNSIAVARWKALLLHRRDHSAESKTREEFQQMDATVTVELKVQKRV